MNLKRTRFAALLLALALSGCLAPASPKVPAPTLAPPTAVAPTSSPRVVVLSPTAAAPTAAPTRTAAPGTKLPSSSTSPSAPPALIQINSPGAGSKVTSPLKVSGESNGTFEQNLVVAVYDAAGKQLALKPTTIQAELGQRGAFSVELAFSVTKEQAGRITVYDTSPAHGGILHLASVEVTLRPAGGKTELLPAKPAPDLIRVTRPAAMAQASGGKLLVEGVGGPLFENQFSLALCGAGGSGKADLVCGTANNVIVRASAAVKAAGASQQGPFSVQLAYTVKEKTPAWLVVYDSSARDGGLIFVSALPVQLLP